jgi:hypothetical protein
MKYSGASTVGFWFMLYCNIAAIKYLVCFLIRDQTILICTLYMCVCVCVCVCVCWCEFCIGVRLYNMLRCACGWCCVPCYVILCFIWWNGGAGCSFCFGGCLGIRK